MKPTCVGVPSCAQGVLTCQHGPDECKANRFINCAQHVAPRQAAWFPFVLCLEKAWPDSAAAGPQCAAAAKVDWAAIDRCTTGDGQTLPLPSASALNL